MYVLIATDPSDGHELCVNGLLDSADYPTVAGDYPPLPNGLPRIVIPRVLVQAGLDIPPNECWGFDLLENAQLGQKALEDLKYPSRIQELS